MSESHLTRRLLELEERTQQMERRLTTWRRASVAAAVMGALVYATAVEASKARKELVIADANSGAEVVIQPDGIRFLNAGEEVMNITSHDGWSGMTVYSSPGHPATFIGIDDNKSTMKLYSAKTNKLLIETSESLLDAGSGIRLYDQQGAPRATLYAERRGEAGVEFTDANRQPRIDIYAKPDGVSVIRASDSSASAVAELSVLPESDAMVRYTGFVPEPAENEPLIPMMYLHDKSGQRVMKAPGFGD